MNELQLIKKQATLVIQAVDEMQNIKNEIKDMRSEFQKDIDEIRSTYPLNRGEAILLNTAIKNKANELTRIYFGRSVSKELYGKKRVHISNALGHQLKKAFNSITYNTIRHLDYDDAKNFVNQFEINNLPPHILRLTEKQYEISLKNGDNLPEDFIGAHMNRLPVEQFEFYYPGG